MKQPLVSILIPTYNRQDFILECIQSAVDQTYKNIEIVVSDNCSTDNTYDVCRAASTKDPRIKVLSTGKNLGPVANWINCLKNSSGKYIKILFSDDLLASDCIERMIDKIQHPDVAFVYSSVLIGTTPKNALLKYKNFFGPLFRSKSIYKKILYQEMPVSPCALLFRRPDFEKNLQMNFPSKVRRDYAKNGAGPDVMLSILTANNYEYICYIDKPLIFFRAHENSFTISNSENKVSEGYASSICWHLYKNNQKILWAKTILKYWVKDCIFHKKIINLGGFIASHEGVKRADFFWIFIALISTALKTPIILFKYTYFIFCNKHEDLDIYTRN